MPRYWKWLSTTSLHLICSLRYTLLVGKPPFETSCLKETYNRIKKNSYTIPWVSWLNRVHNSLPKIYIFLSVIYCFVCSTSTQPPQLSLRGCCTRTLLRGRPSLSSKLTSSWQQATSLCICPLHVSPCPRGSLSPPPQLQSSVSDALWLLWTTKVMNIHHNKELLSFFSPLSNFFQILSFVFLIYPSSMLSFKIVCCCH